jgi:hypothetical protein
LDIVTKIINLFSPSINGDRLPIPNTYQPNLSSDPRMQRAQVFDPALWHFSRRAFKLGEPVFQDPEIANRWFEARQQVIDTILQVIRDSQWHEHLVLRGSLLLTWVLYSHKRKIFSCK